MAYTPTNWQDRPSTATPVSAANLNKMEQGIADAVPKTGTLLTTNNALNAAKTAGFYSVASSVTGVPDPGLTSTLVVSTGPPEPSIQAPITQTLTVVLDGSEPPRVYVRAWDIQNEGPWTPWGLVTVTPL